MHPKAQQAALGGSLSDIGWVDEIKVNRRTGFMVDGHARVELALARHELTVPVSYLDLTEAEENEMLATYDPISAMAGRDDERLRGLLSAVQTSDAGVHALLATLAKAASVIAIDASVQLRPGATFQVIISCDTEQAQATLCEELEARGLKCRLLTL